MVGPLRDGTYWEVIRDLLAEEANRELMGSLLVLESVCGYKARLLLDPYFMQSVSFSALLARGVEAKRSFTRGQTDALPDHRLFAPKTET